MKCSHTLSTHEGLFSPSSMKRIRETADEIEEECRICGERILIRRSHGGKIRTEQAEGQREEQRLRFAEEILQPWNPDGSPNERYRKAYGGLPGSDNRQGDSQDTGDS